MGVLRGARPNPGVGSRGRARARETRGWWWLLRGARVLPCRSEGHTYDLPRFLVVHRRAETPAKRGNHCARSPVVTRGPFVLWRVRARQLEARRTRNARHAQPGRARPGGRENRENPRQRGRSELGGLLRTRLALFVARVVLVLPRSKPPTDYSHPADPNRKLFSGRVTADPLSRATSTAPDQTGPP